MDRARLIQAAELRWAELSLAIEGSIGARRYRRYCQKVLEALRAAPNDEAVAAIEAKHFVTDGEDVVILGAVPWFVGEEDAGGQRRKRLIGDVKDAVREDEVTRDEVLDELSAVPKEKYEAERAIVAKAAQCHVQGSLVSNGTGIGFFGATPQPVIPDGLRSAPMIAGGMHNALYAWDATSMAPHDPPRVIALDGARGRLILQGGVSSQWTKAYGGVYGAR